jgi:hypothetical protein
MKSPSTYHFCRNKVRHESEKSALLFGRKYNQTTAYRCPKCHYWHLTSRPAIEADEFVEALFLPLHG